MKIYTRQGDKGMTSLAGGIQVPKTHLRLEVYGTIDELNSWIGLLLTEIEDNRIIEMLQSVQQSLFAVGGYLATDTQQTQLKPAPRITDGHIQQLEQAIDLLDSDLPALHEFIIPGGCRSTALAHVCRTVCRRAERTICRLNELTPVDESMGVYMNRLSDLLFVIARYTAQQQSVIETKYVP